MKRSTFIRVLRQYAAHARRFGRDYSSVVDQLEGFQREQIGQTETDPKQRAAAIGALEAVVDREYPRKLRLLPYPKKEAATKGEKSATEYRKALNRE